jgi:hypothetical protein
MPLYGIGVSCKMSEHCESPTGWTYCGPQSLPMLALPQQGPVA